MASEIEVDPVGASALIDAFRTRLAEVDQWPGFRHLEVWEDDRSEGLFLMISWWDSECAFRAYMRSDSHRRSHTRIPTEPASPRPAGLRRFRVVAE